MKLDDCTLLLAYRVSCFGDYVDWLTLPIRGSERFNVDSVCLRRINMERYICLHYHISLQ
jgi:hypothetical protein